MFNLVNDKLYLFYFAIENNHSTFCFSEGQEKYWREILKMIFELQSTVLKGIFSKSD